MLRRVLTVVACLFASIAIVSFWDSLWVRIVAAVVMIAVVSWCCRCRHAGSLGLLPSTINDKGEPTPAQWFCPDCGVKWRADFHRTTAPIPRFTGYDPKKAVAAAQRAEELQLKTRRLALDRAGVKPVRVRA